MRIGIPKEIKNNENRIAVTPQGVADFIKDGHVVIVQKGAGLGSGFSDEEYIKAGADLGSQADVWKQEMVMKVKEPLESEYKYFKKGLILFTYLHLAAEPELTKALVDSHVSAIAYETVLGVLGGPKLPLLSPMSEVAGRRAVIISSTCLETHNGGCGLLPGGVTGTEKGHFTIVGGGKAGYNSAFTAAGLGANVTVLEMCDTRIKELQNDKKLNNLKSAFDTNIDIVKSTNGNLEAVLEKTDVLISTVLIPGAKAQRVVTEDHVKMMKKGSVIVDIAIDQGGSVETIDRITTHDNPTFVKHDVIHYSVANMPGAAPRTSSIALFNATQPYALLLANKGLDALKQSDDISKGFLKGLNTHNGLVTYSSVATALDYDYTKPLDALK